MQRDLFYSGYSKDEISTLLENAQGEVRHFVTDMPIELIIRKFTGLEKGDIGDIYIPKYQRAMKWDAAKQSYFIESLLLRLPCQPLFFCEIEGRLEVVDGSQRVRTISNYTSNNFALSGLENLEFLNGSYFDDLPTWAARKFLNTPIRVFMVESSPDDSLQYELFRRINTYSKPLEDAEIRLGAFRGPFLDLVLECSASQKFNELIASGRSNSPSFDNSYQKQELVTRFLIYIDNYMYFSHDVRRFIDNKFKMYNKIKDRELYKRLKYEFDRVIDFYYEHNRLAFRKTKGSTLVPRVRFEALSVGAALAMRSENALNTNFDWLNSPEFMDLVRTEASNSAPKLRSRIEFVRDRLLLNE